METGGRQCVSVLKARVEPRSRSNSTWRVLNRMEKRYSTIVPVSQPATHLYVLLLLLAARGLRHDAACLGAARITAKPDVFLRSKTHHASASPALGPVSMIQSHVAIQSVSLTAVMIRYSRKKHKTSSSLSPSVLDQTTRSMQCPKRKRETKTWQSVSAWVTRGAGRKPSRCSHFPPGRKNPIRSVIAPGLTLRLCGVLTT